MLKGSMDAKKKRFIKAMVKVDSVEGLIKAYMHAYPTCKKETSARVGGYRLLQDPAVWAEIDRLKRKREQEIEEARKQEIQRIAKEQIATEVEIDAAMSMIATGRFRQKKLITKYDSKDQEFKQIEVDEAPDPAAMASAADKLYKRKGSYKPVTIQHEGGDSFIDFMKGLATITNKNIPNEIQPGGHQ